MNVTPAVAPAGSIKFKILNGLRRCGLLGLADGGKFLLARVRTWPANRRFRQRFPDFAIPPKHLSFDALNHVDWARYRSSGLQHAGLFARVIRDERADARTLEVLEWGCGPGRLIRHLGALLPGVDLTLTGADYNGQSIDWCRRHLPGASFVENQLMPPLPLGTARFDVVYCFSVFTHLSEAVQLAWARELGRVLKPGGLLICTTHGDAYLHLLTTAAERQAYAAGAMVAQSGYQEGRKWFLAVHPEAFVRSRLLAGWQDVKRVQPTEAEGMLQDVWVARRPPA